VPVKLKRLELGRFTAFEKASFDFESGVNVLIGENGTGKSHVLKLIYCVQESIRRHVTGEGTGATVRVSSLDEVLAEMLVSVFQPDELGRLVRRGRQKAKVRATWSEKKRARHIEITLTSRGRLEVVGGSIPDLERSIFIPTREILSIFPGFISSWLNRESSFDRTYYDLCVALDAKPLREARREPRAKLLAPIEHVLGGRVVNEGGRFYLKLPDGDMEAPLVAEGLRKLGMLAYLVANGSLSENGYLLWDEPEASMNPRLTTLTGNVVLGLARLGILENKRRQARELPLEIGLKARDTIAGVAGLVSLGNPPELPERWLRAVRGGNRPIHVVAWVAEDPARPGELAHKRKIREQERLSVLKQRLAWLTPRVWVSNPLTATTVPGVSATSLHGAGPARRP
jgi:energy-coupling factor transporter ATP-binding protein EcfA2